MSLPLVVVIALGADDHAPVTRHLERFEGHAEIRVARLDDDEDLATLGVPVTARTVLDPDDLVALARPRVIAAALADHELVTVLDGRVVVTDAAAALDTGTTGSMTLHPLIAPAAALARPSLRALREAGVGRASTAMIHLRAGEVTDTIVAYWRRTVDEAYLAGPTHRVVSAELDLLAAAPTMWPAAVRWRVDGSLARWSDLVGTILPAVTDLRGVDAHLGSDGASLDYISARGVRDRAAIAALLATCGGIRTPDAPTSWRDGVALGPDVLAWVRAVDPLGVRFADPLGAEVRAHLEAEGTGGLSRYARSLYWARPDLQASFPPRSPIASFAGWLEAEGVGPAPGTEVAADELGAPAGSGAGRVLRGARRRVERRLGADQAAIAAPRPIPAEPVGVNVVGFLSAASGLGVAARATVDAVHDLGYPASTHDLSDRVYSPRVHEAVAGRAAGTPYDVTVAHLNPVELHGYAHDDLAFRLGADRTVGFWFWETDTLPASWHVGIDLVDEIWTGSTFLGGVFGRGTDRPVHVVPLPVEVPDVTGDRAALGIADDAFVVSFVCDAFSGIERKNPHLAIEAFTQAFGEDPGAQLIVKIGNLAAFPTWAARLHELAGPNVTILDGHLPHRAVHGLLAASDAYLSLHASEGYGLTVLEAMAHGVPVISTDHGGTTDLVVEGTTGLTVPHTLVPATGGPAGVYGEGGNWAAPEVATAAMLLTRLRADAELRARLGDGARAAAATRSRAAYAAAIDVRLRACGLS